MQRLSTLLSNTAGFGSDRQLPFLLFGQQVQMESAVQVSLIIASGLFKV
nr:hypothetical protein [Acetanaerobacterium elongatum]